MLMLVLVLVAIVMVIVTSGLSTSKFYLLGSQIFEFVTEPLNLNRTLTELQDVMTSVTGRTPDQSAFYPTAPVSLFVIPPP